MLSFSITICADQISAWPKSSFPFYKKTESIRLSDLMISGASCATVVIIEQILLFLLRKKHVYQCDGSVSLWQLGCCLFLYFISFFLVSIFLFTDYRLPMKPFSSKFQTFGLGQTIWADIFWGMWGIFGRLISTHFGRVSPLSMFYINQPLFLPKLSLCIQIPNMYLGLGFEFGPQRIRNLAIACPQSVFLIISKIGLIDSDPGNLTT